MSESGKATRPFRDDECTSRNGAEKRGRKAIGDRAMTAAERQQRRRDRHKARLPPPGSEDRFRLELYWWLEQQTSFLFQQLTAQQVSRALEQLATAWRMDEWAIGQGKQDPAESTWIEDYLNRTGLCDPDWGKEATREEDNSAG